MKNLIVTFILSVLILGCEERILGPDAGNSPQNNFEILWKTFDEKYPLFSARHIDWDSLHAVYGEAVASSTSEDQLWGLCTGLLSNLNDGHVVLINRNCSKVYSSGNADLNKKDGFSLDLIKSKFLDSCRIVGDSRITFGKIAGTNIGYIYISSFTATASGNGVDWAYAIDSAVAALNHCDGMIIDVRNNGGGLRVTGDIINSTFIDRDITYFYQRLKTGPGHDDFGPERAVTIFLRPGVPTYTKKIAFLTNRFSASGAEYAARIFKNLPYSTQIGDTTFGAIGEITADYELPNGWVFWFPVTLVTTPDGFCPDGIGIAPNIVVENFRADIAAGRDNVLSYAVRFLQNQNP